MGSGLYAACSALMARSQALDILSNNLANVNTTGYKGESQFYQALDAATGTGAGGAAGSTGALDAAVNQYGILAGEGLNLSAGAVEKTSNPLDVAIAGPGFLEVQSKAGVVYTRAGNLQIGPMGTLLTADGDPVLGVGAKGAPDKPITVPNGAVSISPDGTLSVDGALVAKLRLVEFPPTARLTPIGDTYFSAPAGAGTPATQSHLDVGALESSNVNAIQAETDLIGLQRHFDLLERALQIINSDFDQAATSELPRLS
ncbi:MAG TPA: flagellar hook basal-body protein [Terriglobales bacterium]